MSVRRPTSVSAAALLVVATIACREPGPGLTPQAATTGPKAAAASTGGETPLFDRPVVREALDRAAREAAADPRSSDPRVYAAKFEAMLRPTIEEQTGTEISPLPIDRRKAADGLYANLRPLLARLRDTTVFDGDSKEGKVRTEVASLVPSEGLCSAVVIARNAIATAQHCTDSAVLLIGPASITATRLTIDPNQFHRASTSSGAPLDLAVLVQSGTIAGVQQTDLPTFASGAQIAAATEFEIVGFGGRGAQSQDAGLRRVGTIPKVPGDCSAGAQETAFGCVPGFELVGGAYPLVDRMACAVATAGNPQQGACKGDSGGAVYVRVGTQRFLAGIISRVNKLDSCDCSAATSVYTRLDVQRSFLTSLGIEFSSGAFQQLDAAPAGGGTR